jgi:hypothetical protein
MRRNSDVLTAVVARARGRSVVRAVTVTAGVAGLAGAAVIAYELPAPAHHTPSGGTLPVSTATPAATHTPAATAWRGDDGGQVSRSRSGSAGHATSGGS